ncbi:MAG: O-methyltransferase [Bradymonadia bacterium]
MLTPILVSLALIGIIALLVLSVRHTHLIRRDIRRAQRRSEAWAHLHQSISPRIPLPLTTPWTASPELLVILSGLIAEHTPRRVVELGSGFSTLISAYTLEQHVEGGRVIAFDHEAQYAQATRDMITAHGLTDRATVVHAPLDNTQTSLGEKPWYHTGALEAALEGEQIGLVLVDGPPGGTASLARHPAFEKLKPFLAPDALVVIDDSARDDEQKMIHHWRTLEQLEQRDHPVEKGVVVLRRGANA